MSVAELGRDVSQESACRPVEVPAGTLEERLLASLPLLAEDGVSLDRTLSSSDLRSRVLYFGTGLCTTKAMSAGIPFEFLGLVTTAETIRRICGFDRVIQLIADSHAKSNHFVSDEEVDRRAKELRQLSLRIAERFGLTETYEVLLASDFDSSPEYQEILSSISPDSAHEYTRREWTDMEYLARHRGVGLKLSWKMPLKKGKAHRSDETFFDEGFKARFARPYSFVYNCAALTFDPTRFNVCPYTSAPGEKRLLLQTGENVEAKLAEFCADQHKAKERALEQTATIMRFVEHTFAIVIPGSTLAAKADALIRSFV